MPVLSAIDPALGVVLALLSAGAGVASIRLARSRRDDTGLRLAWVGAVSSTTLHVGGAAGVLLAYHALTHAFGLHQFRAPLWAGPIGAGVAVALSLLVDRLDNRHDSADPSAQSSPPGPAPSPPRGVDAGPDADRS